MRKMTARWNYPEQEPSFLHSGSFTACIAGTGSESRSAAAWKIWRDEARGFEIEDIKISKGRSTAPRASLAAAAGALEALKPNSSINLHCRQEYVVKIINIYRHTWKQDSKQKWINASGKEVCNSDIVSRIDSVIRSRNLSILAHHCSNEHSNLGMEISNLLYKAAKAVKESLRIDANAGVTP
jgi:ribonuclease HI